jgi:hypothetical protein
MFLKKNKKIFWKSITKEKQKAIEICREYRANAFRKDSIN